MSAKRVVKDVVIDDLIENAAIERRDPGLLAYSDSGGVLTLDQDQISTDEAGSVRVLRVDDSVSNMEVGVQVDPNNPAAQIAVVVQGVETTKQRTASQEPHTASQKFKVLIWLIWSTDTGRYLQCDVSTLS
ncbi:MAG: hypothetical protein WA751_01920 [Candidatus Dormiibacterota bacterium]